MVEKEKSQFESSWVYIERDWCKRSRVLPKVHEGSLTIDIHVEPNFSIGSLAFPGRNGNHFSPGLEDHHWGIFFPRWSFRFELVAFSFFVKVKLLEENIISLSSVSTILGRSTYVANSMRVGRWLSRRNFVLSLPDHLLLPTLVFYIWYRC